MSHVYAMWEHGFRPRLVKARGVALDDVTDPLRATSDASDWTVPDLVDNPNVSELPQRVEAHASQLWGFKSEERPDPPESVVDN